MYLRFTLLLKRCGGSNLSKLKLHLFWIHLVFSRWSSVVVQIYPKCLCIYGFVKNFERGGFSKGFRKCVAVRICPRICFCGESISKNAFCRFESVYRPEMMREQSSARKCIYKILKNFRVEKVKHSLREYEAQACGLYEAAALPP